MQTSWIKNHNRGLRIIIKKQFYESKSSELKTILIACMPLYKVDDI